MEGNRPIANAYDIKHIESNVGMNFKALLTMIHQLKFWIRITYSLESDFNKNSYFNEFCFRINCSQIKATILNSLISKMALQYKVHHNKVTRK